MKISIAEPCHENWDAMTPNKQGAFCNSCVKDVVDFSNKSIEEIKNFFSKPQTGKVCGRFEEKQLQELSFEDFFSRFTYWNFSKKFAVIFFMAFGFWIFSNSAAFAQNNDHMMKGEVMIMPEKNVKHNTVTTVTHQEAEKRMIKGKIARTCSPEITGPEAKIKGNTKVEPTIAKEEQRMMMGMIAYRPNKEKEPVVKTGPKITGDTTVTQDFLGNNEIKTPKDNSEEVINKISILTTTEKEITKTVEQEKTITNDPKLEKIAEVDKTNVETKISVYPNPNAGKFIIETATKQTVTILDENGKIVLSQTIDGTTNINASHLRAGIYSVNLVGDEGRVTKRVVITK